MLPCFADKSNIRHPYQDPDAGHPQLLWRSEEPFERRHGKAVKEGGFMDARRRRAKAGQPADGSFELG